jgi:hypothetical protein
VTTPPPTAAEALAESEHRAATRTAEPDPNADLMKALRRNLIRRTIKRLTDHLRERENDASED